MLMLKSGDNVTMFQNLKRVIRGADRPASVHRQGARVHLADFLPGL